MFDRHAYDRDGFAVVEGVFDGGELDRLRAVVEDVAESVRSRAERPGAGASGTLEDGHRIQFSSRTAIQWEWQEGSREIRLLEPCHHLDPALDDLFGHPRLTALASAALGIDEVGPFTSKLNLKRPEEGSEFPWHQDYPYWYVWDGVDADATMTAIIFLDDATRENGAIRVLPGSHHAGPAPRHPQDPTGFLADPGRLPVEDEALVECAAGSVLVFGSLLVHRSSPNTSDRQRRALLYSYQPAGRPILQEHAWHPERVADLP